MDKITKEKCINKTGRVTFARVLIEISADKQIPYEIPLEYPATVINNISTPRRIVNLKVGYQWKPSRCSHCCVFGHTIERCIKKSKIAQGLDDQSKKEGLRNENGRDETNGTKMHPDEGFKVVRRRNRFNAGMWTVKHAWNGQNNNDVSNIYSQHNRNLQQHIMSKQKLGGFRKYGGDVGQSSGQTWQIKKNVSKNELNDKSNAINLNGKGKGVISGLSKAPEVNLENSLKSKSCQQGITPKNNKSDVRLSNKFSVLNNEHE